MREEVWVVVCGVRIWTDERAGKGERRRGVAVGECEGGEV
jgi:hypothetical protein